MANKVTQIDTTKTYKFIPVSEETHKRLSILKAEGAYKNFDQLLAELIVKK